MDNSNIEMLRRIGEAYKEIRALKTEMASYDDQEKEARSVLFTSYNMDCNKAMETVYDKYRSVAPENQEVFSTSIMDPGKAIDARSMRAIITSLSFKEHENVKKLLMSSVNSMRRVMTNMRKNCLNIKRNYLSR